MLDSAEGTCDPVLRSWLPSLDMEDSTADLARLPHQLLARFRGPATRERSAHPQGPSIFLNCRGVLMFTLLGSRQRFCHGISRRNFLQIRAFRAGLTLADLLR